MILSENRFPLFGIMRQRAVFRRFYLHKLCLGRPVLSIGVRPGTPMGRRPKEGCAFERRAVARVEIPSGDFDGVIEGAK
jgi:hypothetical protein